MSDSTIYPDDTVDSVGENMSDCKIYPADTVDIYGNVWPTVGENIRNGLFGFKVNRGFIKINNNEVTSTDFLVYKILEKEFHIDKIAILTFPVLNTGSYVNFSLRVSPNDSTAFVSSNPLNKLNCTLEVIYLEK